MAAAPQPARDGGSAAGSARALLRKADLMDIIFLLVILVLYGLTHWVASAISRLGGIE